MARTPAEHIGDTIVLFSSAFENVTITRREERPDRSLLELWGQRGAYRIRFLEVLPEESSERKYAYYVLKEGEVVVGFDNASDPRVLRLKYGKHASGHIGELAPHMHGRGKTTLELTSEMDCVDFIAWVRMHLPEGS